MHTSPSLIRFSISANCRPNSRGNNEVENRNDRYSLIFHRMQYNYRAVLYKESVLNITIRAYISFLANSAIVNKHFTTRIIRDRQNEFRVRTIRLTYSRNGYYVWYKLFHTRTCARFFFRKRTERVVFRYIRVDRPRIFKTRYSKVTLFEKEH